MLGEQKTDKPLVFPTQYALHNAALSDIRTIQRLHQDAFGRDAYDKLTLGWLLLWPANINLKALGETGQLVGHITGSPRPLMVLPGLFPWRWRRATAGMGWAGPCWNHVSVA